MKNCDPFVSRPAFAMATAQRCRNASPTKRAGTIMAKLEVLIGELKDCERASSHLVVE